MYKQRVIGLLAVCVAITGGIVLLRPSAATPTPDTLEEFWSAKTFLGEGAYDVVVIGDSRSLMGVAPSAMHETLPGRRILNFAFLGAGLTPELVTAGLEKLDPNASDRVLVLGVTPLSLASFSLGNDHFRQESAKPRRAEPPSDFETEVRRVFQPFDFPERETAEPRANPESISIYREGGWLASDGTPANPKLALDSYRRHFARGTFDEPNFAKLLELLRRTSANGVKIHAFRHPSSRKMEQLEDRISGFHEAYVRRRLGDAGVTWLPFKSRRGLSLEFPSYDGSHLKPEGALFFSAGLGQRIAEAGSSPH